VTAAPLVAIVDIMAAKYKPRVLLGTDSHVMQWNPILNIYR
jgi:hypothetical protein